MNERTVVVELCACAPVSRCIWLPPGKSGSSGRGGGVEAET